MSDAANDVESSAVSSKPEHTAQMQPLAGKNSRAWTIFLITSVVGLLADLWSKSYAFQHVAGFPVHIDREQVMRVNDLGILIPDHDPVTVMDKVLEFTLVLNPGAVFGIGAGQRWFEQS